MRSMYRRSWAVITLILAITPVDSFGRESAATRPPVSVEKLGPELTVVRIAGISTIVLKGTAGVLVVDPGLEEAAPFLREEIDKLGGGQIATIIDTHWHFDHAGGNKVFGAQATIIASRPTREWLSSEQWLLGTRQEAYPAPARPTIEADPIHAIPGYADDVIVTAMPGGHTGGDVVVHFSKESVLAIGDLVFAGQFPFVDVDHGGNVVGLAEVLRQIIEEHADDTRIVPGHGPLLSMEDLKAYRRMVLETTQIVRDEMARGRSLEQIRADAALDAWKDWDGSFRQDDWIGFIYQSLVD